MKRQQTNRGARRRDPALAPRIVQRAALAGLDLPLPLAGRLAAYVDLLQRWNARLNLTALDASDHGLDRLVIEPLAAARHVPQATVNVIDIGSGSGSPAVPLRMALAHMPYQPAVAAGAATNAGEKRGLGSGSLVMVEARQRKAAFLREAVRQLEITDCAVETGRFETLTERADLRCKFDLLTVRGVRIGAAELQRLEKYVAQGGQLFLFRSGTAEHLPAEIPPPLAWLAEYPLVESLGSRLVVLQKAQPDSA